MYIKYVLDNKCEAVKENKKIKDETKNKFEYYYKNVKQRYKQYLHSISHIFFKLKMYWNKSSITENSFLNLKGSKVVFLL